MAVSTVSVRSVTVVAVSVGAVTVVAVSVTVSVMSVVDAAVATVNNTVVVKIFLEMALSMSAAGLLWCVMIVLETALSVSAAIMAEIVMKIMITVVGFVEVTTVSVVVLLSVASAISMGALWCGVRSVVVLGSVGIFVNEVIGTAVGSTSTLVVEVSKLIELGSAVEETISAGVSKTINIVPNALTSCVISGSIKNFVI